MIDKKVNEVLTAFDNSPLIQDALFYLKNDYGRMIQELKEMALVSGAPYSELEIRSPMLKKKLIECGLEDVFIDEVGNVFGYLRGKTKDTVLVEAHIDTVFASEVELKIQEDQNGVFHCPGIGDNTAALAVMLSVVRAIKHFNLFPEKTILFGGTVGEEAPGQARGVKYIMEHYKDLVAYICLDCSDDFDITLEAVSCRRHECIFKGPGGHSWEDFGNANPIMAMSRGFAHIAELTIPQQLKTSYNVGIISGGTTVNSIPGYAACHIDIRSLDLVLCKDLEQQILDCLKRGIEEENAAHPGSHPIVFEDKPYGIKPGGRISAEHPIVQVAMETAKRVGIKRKITPPASTNANFPLALGIPSYCLNCSGPVGNIHTEQEWYDPKESWKGAQDLLLNIFAVAGLRGISDSLL